MSKIITLSISIAILIKLSPFGIICLGANLHKFSKIKTFQKENVRNNAKIRTKKGHIYINYRSLFLVIV